MGHLERAPSVGSPAVVTSGVSIWFPRIESPVGVPWRGYPCMALLGDFRGVQWREAPFEGVPWLGTPGGSPTLCHLVSR